MINYRYIKNKNVSLKAIKKWAVQILNGLNYLHSRNPPIIHKDLKCANLFIDGVVSLIRIGDLGLASYSTKESPIAGTIPYMAPEIIDSNIYNEKTDMYAFGMCLLEILTKKTPYSECVSTNELIAKILSVFFLFSLYFRTNRPQPSPKSPIPISSSSSSSCWALRTRVPPPLICCWTRSCCRRATRSRRRSASRRWSSVPWRTGSPCSFLA